MPVLTFCCVHTVIVLKWNKIIYNQTPSIICFIAVEAGSDIMSPCGAARLRHDCVIIGAAALPGITAIGHLLCRHPVIGASGLWTEDCNLIYCAYHRRLCNQIWKPLRVAVAQLLSRWQVSTTDRYQQSTWINSTCFNMGILFMYLSTFIISSFSVSKVNTTFYIVNLPNSKCKFTQNIQISLLIPKLFIMDPKDTQTQNLQAKQKI